MNQMEGSLFKKPGLLPCFTLLSVAIVVFTTIRIPQKLYTDSAWQLKALQQFINQESPTINHIMEPVPGDLSKDRPRWINLWPPGPMILLYPWVSWGGALGCAVRGLIILCYVVGSLGWMRWISLFRMPYWIKAILAFAVPWTAYPTQMFYTGFSAEIAAYASLPLALLATHSLGEMWEKRNTRVVATYIAPACVGLGLGLTYWLKYSAIFLPAGAMIYLGITAVFRGRFRGVCPGPSEVDEVRRRKNGLVRKMAGVISARPFLGSFFLAGLLFLAPILCLNFLNYTYGEKAHPGELNKALNPVTGSSDLNLRWTNVLFSVANPVLGVVNANQFWYFFLFDQKIGLLRNIKIPDSLLWGAGHSLVWRANTVFMGLLALPGGLLLLWLILRARCTRQREKLARCAFLANLAILFGVWCLVTKGVSYDTRYMVCASLAILPLALQEGCHLWKTSNRWILRVFFGAAALAYLGFPVIYNGYVITEKIVQKSDDYPTVRDYIACRYLSIADSTEIEQKLLKDYSPERDIWFVTDPTLALILPGRTIINTVDYKSMKALRGQRYSSSRPMVVHALLLKKHEQKGIGTVVRSAFRQAGPWTKQEIRGTALNLWTATLNQKR